MPASECKTFAQFVGPRIEGERRPEFESHLSVCEDCQNLLADLEAIRASARGLELEELDPPAQVWTAIRARLEQERLIRESGRAHRFAEWLGTLVPAVPRPVVAGAYIALLVAGALFVGFHHPFQQSGSGWYNGLQANTASLSSSLDSAERTTNADLRFFNPVVAASLHKNLALVDNYIRACEKSVREEPDNEMARDYLYDAYQQKADLLNEISERGVGVQ